MTAKSNPSNGLPSSLAKLHPMGDGTPHCLQRDNQRNLQTAPLFLMADFMESVNLMNFKVDLKAWSVLTRWIEKWSQFSIHWLSIMNQVKFATCTLLGAALTWWNSQIRTLGPEAYAMTWEVLKKKMTDKYCPQGEIKKLEIKLWNLKFTRGTCSSIPRTFPRTIPYMYQVCSKNRKVYKTSVEFLTTFMGRQDLPTQDVDDTYELGQ
ncbi:reverse transcriptase domain-containing protein [Tanacetum coccineum]